MRQRAKERNKSKLEMNGPNACKPRIDTERHARPQRKIGWNWEEKAKEEDAHRPSRSRGIGRPGISVGCLRS